jgi:hypothetical protein
MRTAIALILGLAAVVLCGCQPRTAKAPVQPTPAPSSPAPPPEPLPIYHCRRTPDPITIDGRIEKAWEPEVEVARLVAPWSADPATPRNTVARLLWDDDYLYVGFQCPDPDIQGSMKQRDQNLWEEDEVVELFADAGADQGCYLEFEVNPLNTVVDLVIPKAGSPGPIEGKKMWDAKGMRTAVSTLPGGWRVEMAIPLVCFLDAPNTPPKPGDEWRINLYRVDAVREQVEYQAWSPTNTPEPSFHVPERFGTLRFE